MVKFPNRNLLFRTASAMASVVACLALHACDRFDRKPAGPAEKVTLAIAVLPDTALAQIAQARGFFRDEGLDVTVRRHRYGKPALQEVLDGKADFATVAETPVIFAVMDGAKIAVIATIMTSNTSHAVLARKDRGIVAIENLKGKRIAVTSGTTSEFFLNTFLVTHKISPHEVKIVNLKAEDIPEALARGDIDAASTFMPFSIAAQRKLGEKAVVFQDRDIYRDFFNVVTTQELIRRNPGMVGKVLSALVRAEVFAGGHPDEAQKIVINFKGLQKDMVREFFANASFKVTLDQQLVLSLEDESDWAIRNRLTRAKNAPNYLNNIYLDGLRMVKPDAVRIMR